MDVSFSQARRFTGLGQQRNKACSFSKSHSLITENGDKSSNWLKIITFFSTYLSQISVDVLKKLNNFSVPSEKCILSNVEHLLITALFG